jgi:hypothetical protein
MLLLRGNGRPGRRQRPLLPRPCDRWPQSFIPVCGVTIVSVQFMLWWLVHDPPQQGPHMQDSAKRQQSRLKCPLLNSTAQLPGEHYLMKCFCIGWSLASKSHSSTSFDVWWSQNFDFVAVHQSADVQCFQRLFPDAASSGPLDWWGTIYRVHQSSETTAARTKYVSNSGFALDISYVVDGLLYSVQQQAPVQFVVGNPTKTGDAEPWKYARGSCQTQDMFCYFLPFAPINNSGAVPGHAIETTQRHQQADSTIEYWYPWQGFHRNSVTGYLMWYATSRQYEFLRYRVAQTVAKQGTFAPCVALHVRRADVILHGKWSRRYHAIREYIEAIPSQSWIHQAWSFVAHPPPLTLLLLTDDANAVTEALTEFPQHHWIYLNRSRFHGPEGGWENPIPSGNPTNDMVQLLAEVELAKQCNTLISFKSNFADYVYANMLFSSKAGAQIASSTATYVVRPGPFPRQWYSVDQSGHDAPRSRNS